MSKFDLRDVSDRLARSKDTEAVVFEFLGYLQAVRPDWRAALAFYEVSNDALVKSYERQGNRLVRRDVVVPVSQLPARLVRKFFHPSAFFNHSGRRSLMTHLFSGSPAYEADTADAASLRMLTPLPNWQSCICLPIADQEDMLALLVLASEKRNAFGGRTVGDLLPVKSMAALALSQHLYRSARGSEPQQGAQLAQRGAAAEFNDRIHRLNSQSSALEEDNRAKNRKLEALGKEIAMLDQNSTQYKQELERAKGALGQLEEQSAAAASELTEAYSQLNLAQARLAQTQRTLAFVRDAVQVLTQQHDPKAFSSTLVTWLCEQFGVERCSLMLLDEPGECLMIAAQRGMDPLLAAQTKVRIGQGVSGWVAHNRKPLFVRVKDEPGASGLSGREDDNSDSFVSAPMIYNNRVWGVLNLANKRNGELFEEADLDRATISGSLVAVVLAGQELARRAATWTQSRQAVTVR